MYNLAIAQKSFAAALFDTCAPIPVSLRDAQRRRTESCFAIYRNNAAAGLIQSISSRYPLVRRLAGEDSFRAVAYRYILCEPPRSPVLLHYGETFPRFLRSLGPEPSIAYLAEIAELEMARVKAYHAPDVSPVSREWFSALPQDHLDTICIALHPSVTLLAARSPIVTIWEANQGDKGDGAVRKWGAEDALVARPFLDVNVWRLPPGSHAFLARLERGFTLARAVEAGKESSCDFDITANLAFLVESNIVVGSSVADRIGLAPHENNRRWRGSFLLKPAT